MKTNFKLSVFSFLKNYSDKKPVNMVGQGVDDFTGAKVGSKILNVDTSYSFMSTFIFRTKIMHPTSTK